VLLGLGVTEFSVTPDAIGTVTRMICGTSVEAARALAEELASLPTASAVLARVAASASEPGPACTHGT
jgi:phosphoenolpyruvate-protein kinase (PTS system EI component)